MADIPPPESTTPETPVPPVNNKFTWLKNAKAARANPFVNPRPQLSREDSSAQLCASQQSSTADLFHNSRINFFETAATAPRQDSNKYVKGVSLWHRRSVLEKVLLVTSGVLTFTILVMILLVILDHSAPAPAGCHQEKSLPAPAAAPETSVCLSSSCIHTASAVLNALNPEEDPCDDFYEFACGGWIKNNPIPDGKSSWGIFSKIELQNQLIIRNALEKANATSGDAEAKAKIYYDACLDSNETIENLGATPLLDIIKKLGGWHLLPQTMIERKKINLQKLLQQTQNRYNLGGLFNWAVAEDDRNSSNHVIVLDQGGLNLPTRENYLNKTANKKILDAYLEFMTKICVLLGANKTEAKAHMQKVIDFETEIANITTPAEDRRDEESLYNPMTVAEWQSMVPFINWLNFFNDAFNIVNKSITDKEVIVVYAPDYFKRLSSLIANYKRTDEGQKIINSYIMWMTSRSQSSYLSKSFRDANKVLRKALFGSEGTEESWRYCVTDTNNAFGFAIGAMFVRDVFHKEAKVQGEQMINNIRTAFVKNFGDLRWMDGDTRRAAKIKADAIRDMIGFPDYILHPAELNKQYEDLEVKPDQYFQNNIQVNLFDLKVNFVKLDQPVDKSKWGMNPSTVNAYYTPTKNQIVFPAGILQLPFYDGGNPKSVNYGAMGVVMGHELTHAFDDQGRQYDSKGNLNQWWNNQTIDQFKKRTTCMQDQYSNFALDGMQLNGKQTLGENIADNGGLKASYHAYVAYSATPASHNYTLPGLNYSHRQLFFISFAQVWCSSMTKEATKIQIEKDDHTVAKYRVIGPLSNLKEFSQEFKCPLGSNMNPKHKCEVW